MEMVQWKTRYTRMYTESPEVRDDMGAVHVRFVLRMHNPIMKTSFLTICIPNIIP
jgi:hypothetical protein